MRIDPFDMERMQSTWENVVEINLSESGVHPMTLRELLREDDRMEAFLDSPAAYSQSNGTPELRSILADHYRGATPDHILVTCGSSEANFLATWRLVDKGDEVVLMLPNYMQIWGLVRGFGGKVRPLRLREDLGWQFDPEDLKAAVTSKTRAIAVCNPNNPTGAVMGHDQRRAVLDAAEDADAWLLSDEVYLGAEREGPRAESLWGDHEKTLISNGLSKAYGLPGLRIGWLVGPPKEIAALWSHHDYTTIGPTYFSDRLAQIALEPKRREEIFARTRAILRRNYPVVARWIDAHGALFSYVPPTAGAIVYLRYHLDVNSTKLAERLLKEKSVLLVPGDHFGMDGYLRIGTGPEEATLVAGLERIDALLRELKAGRGTR